MLLKKVTENNPPLSPLLGGEATALYSALLNGAVQYSNTVKLQLNSKTAGFSIVKNPAKTVLTIEVKDEALSKTTARLITAQGIVVKTFNLQLGYQNIDISNLKQGMYYLQTNTQTKQVVVE